MVHLGGQEERGPGTGDQGPGSAGALGAGGWGLGRAGVPLIAALAILIFVPPAEAQPAIGFQGGFSVDSEYPEQVFGGVFFQTGDIGRGIRLRPGIDGATGDGLRIANISVDFIYGYPLGGNGWTFLAGGGPSVVITRHKDFDDRDTGVGFHSIVGFGHDSGFFTEIRLGSGRAQQLKVGVGWAITLD